MEKQLCDCGFGNPAEPFGDDFLCLICQVEVALSSGKFCIAYAERDLAAAFEAEIDLDLHWLSDGADNGVEFDDFTPSQGSRLLDPMRGEVWLYPRRKRENKEQKV